PMGPAVLSGPIYAGALVAACPSLPRRTSNQVFFELAKNFDAYDFTKKHFDSELAKLGPLLGYHPDITKALAAAKTASSPGGSIRNDGKILNDRRFALSLIAKSLVAQYGSLDVDARAYAAKSSAIQLESTTIDRELSAMAQLDRAKTTLKNLPPT